MLAKYVWTWNKSKESRRQLVNINVLTSFFFQICTDFDALNRSSFIYENFHRTRYCLRNFSRFCLLFFSSIIFFFLILLLVNNNHFDSFVRNFHFDIFVFVFIKIDRIKRSESRFQNVVCFKWYVNVVVELIVCIDF